MSTLPLDHAKAVGDLRRVRQEAHDQQGRGDAAALQSLRAQSRMGQKSMIILTTTGTTSTEASWHYSTRCEPCGVNGLMDYVACDGVYGYWRAICPQCGEMLYEYIPWMVA